VAGDGILRGETRGRRRSGLSGDDRQSRTNLYFNVSGIAETWKSFPLVLIRGLLERFERSEAVERLERLERAAPPVNGAIAVERFERAAVVGERSGMIIIPFMVSMSSHWNVLNENNRADRR
jgi:hypothetical protein